MVAANAYIAQSTDGVCVCMCELRAAAPPLRATSHTVLALYFMQTLGAKLAICEE